MATLTLKSSITKVSRDKSSSPTSSPPPSRKRKQNYNYHQQRSRSPIPVAHQNDESSDEEGEIPRPPPITIGKPKTTVGLTGGLYMPPAKLRLLQASITDKSSQDYQRLAWEALKKTINGRVNKINISNLVLIVRELFKDNIVRGRGLLARGIIQAQIASPFYTHVYAALVSIINTKLSQIGELIVKRLISAFRRTYQRNDKTNCLASIRFIAHLVNQNVLHEIVALQILILLLENPSDDSCELAIGFIKECGKKLSQISPRGLDSVFSTLRNLLHESTLDKRTQYMIEVLFAIRKDQFKDHPIILDGLDLVEEQDQLTHMLTLDDPCDPEPMLDVFKYDPEYEENENKYKQIRKQILDESDADDNDESSEDEDGEENDGEEEESEDEAEKEKQQTIIDQTETNLVTLRRTIYLTIQSSVGAEECAHKLLKMNLRPGQEMELCQMILDSCAQQRTYERFFGLLGQRFCLLKKEYIECFEKVFQDQYDIVHRLENVKLRNVAKFFAHLLYTDAISWGVLRCIRLTEEDTTSSSRVYIKNLFLELVEFLGLTKLNNRLKDPTLTEYFEGIFPRDNTKNTRFSINFFTSIGLGGLTDELRDFLRTNTSAVQDQQQQPKDDVVDDDDDDDDGNDVLEFHRKLQQMKMATAGREGRERTLPSQRSNQKSPSPQRKKKDEKHSSLTTKKISRHDDKQKKKRRKQSVTSSSSSSTSSSSPSPSPERRMKKKKDKSKRNESRRK